MTKTIEIRAKFDGCVFCLAEAQPNTQIVIWNNFNRTCQEHLDRAAQGRNCICCGTSNPSSDVGIGYEEIECRNCGLNYSNDFDPEWPKSQGMTMPEHFDALYDDPAYAEGWKTCVIVGHKP